MCDLFWSYFKFICLFYCDSTGIQELTEMKKIFYGQIQYTCKIYLILWGIAQILIYWTAKKLRGLFRQKLNKKKHDVFLLVKH